MNWILKGIGLIILLAIIGIASMHLYLNSGIIGYTIKQYSDSFYESSAEPSARQTYQRPTYQAVNQPVQLAGMDKQALYSEVQYHRDVLIDDQRKTENFIQEGAKIHDTGRTHEEIQLINSYVTHVGFTMMHLDSFEKFLDRNEERLLESNMAVPEYRNEIRLKRDFYLASLNEARRGVEQLQQEAETQREQEEIEDIIKMIIKFVPHIL